MAGPRPPWTACPAPCLTPVSQSHPGIPLQNKPPGPKPLASGSAFVKPRLRGQATPMLEGPSAPRKLPAQGTYSGAVCRKGHHSLRPSASLAGSKGPWQPEAPCFGACSQASVTHPLRLAPQAPRLFSQPSSLFFSFIPPCVSTAHPLSPITTYHCLGADVFPQIHMLKSTTAQDQHATGSGDGLWKRS